MDSLQDQHDHYYIFDSKGCRKVVDGKEYPITEEEYRRENPYHKDVGCTECSFVQDKETLLTFLIPRELKAKATNMPLLVGKFTMPEWTGHNNFYIFRCKRCDCVSVDYPHGYGADLWCHCGWGVFLKWREKRKILKMEFPNIELENKRSINFWNVGLVLLILWTVGIILARLTGILN